MKRSIFPVLLTFLFGAPAFPDVGKGVEAIGIGDYATPAKETTPIATSLEGVVISAELYWQAGLKRLPVKYMDVPVEIMCAKNIGLSPVLVILLEIKNNRFEPIVFEPSKLRFHTNRQSTLTPVSPEEIRSKVFVEIDAINNKNPSGEVVGEVLKISAAFLVGLGVAIVTSPLGVIDPEIPAYIGGGAAGMIDEGIEASRRHNSARTENSKDEILDDLIAKQLMYQTIAPNQSVSGYTYFFAQGYEDVLNDPKLRVSVLDSLTEQSYETTLNITTGSATSDRLFLTGLASPENLPNPAIEEPAIDADITGIYISEIIDVPPSNPRKFDNSIFVLKQQGNTIVAGNCTTNEMIHGTRVRNTITFLSSDQQGEYSGIAGELKTNADSSTLEGSWDFGSSLGKWSGEAEWKLTKIQPLINLPKTESELASNPVEQSVLIESPAVKEQPLIVDISGTYMTEAELLSAFSSSTVTSISNVDGVTPWSEKYYALQKGHTMGKIKGIFGGKSYKAWWTIKDGKWCADYGKGWKCNYMERVDESHIAIYKNGKPLEHLWRIQSSNKLPVLTEQVVLTEQAKNEQVVSGTNITGTYSSEIKGMSNKDKNRYSKLNIVQNGNKITGSFGKGQKKFEGSIEGDTFEIYWVDAWAAGEVKFKVGPDDQITGNYFWGNGVRGQWNLHRLVE